MYISIDGTPLLGVRTGVGEFVAGLLPSLVANKELEIKLFSFSLREHKCLPVNIPRAALPIPASPVFKIWSRVNFPAIEWWAGKIDVVHGTNFVVPPARRAARLVTIHDLAMFRFPEMVTRNSLRYPELIRKAISSGAHVHVPSQFVFDQVCATFKIDPQKVHMIHHGVPPLHAVGERKRADHYIFATGTIESRKNYPYLIRSFDQIASNHPNISLVIAGQPGWGMGEFKSALKSAKYSNRIEYLGYISEENRVQLMRDAYMLVISSVDEGFGFPALEAMALGTPVISTSVGAIPEIVGHAGIVVGENESLAEAINTLLIDGTLALRLSEAGRKQAANFTWEASAKKFVEVYNLISQRN